MKNFLVRVINEGIFDGFHKIFMADKLPGVKSIELS